MKRIQLLVAALVVTGFCTARPAANPMNPAAARAQYGNTLAITPEDKTVTITKDKIIIEPKREGAEYTISGYFNGQIVNKTKNTVIRLKNAYLENTAGQAALYGEAKTEVSATEGTKNFILSAGSSEAKTAALQCKKNLVIGGSGTLYVQGTVYHGAKADDVKIKGNGAFYFQGTKKGSALNCASLTVEKDKSFSAYFLDSKNGIKADATIQIASGTFYLYNNRTALKTDTKADSLDEPHGITLSGGRFYTFGNEKLYSTENKAYKAASGAKIIEQKSEIY